METIYILIEANGYDGYDLPNDHFYLTQQEAEEEAKRLNKLSGYRRDSITVEELTLKK